MPKDFDAKIRTLHISDVTLEALYFFFVLILSSELVTSTGYNLQATKIVLASKRPLVLSLYFRRGIENIYDLSKTRDKSASRMNVIDIGRVSRVTLSSFKI